MSVLTCGGCVQTLKLQLLGPFSLMTPTNPEGARIGRKGQALLASVAGHDPTGVGRADLIDWLWPHHDANQGRNALRQCLHQLRVASGERGDWLITQDDRLKLRADLITVDLWEFERLATTQDSEAMRLAARLYQGDFAEGLDAGNQHHFYLLAERQRTRELAQRLLGRMLEANDDSMSEVATGLARRLLRTDPVHEGCYRALMLLYARSGLGAKAVQVWEDCRKILRAELDVGPSRQTVELYQSLRDTMQEGCAPATPIAVPMARPGPGSAESTNSHLARSAPRAIDHSLRGWQLFSQFTAKANAQARCAFEAALRQEPGNVDALVRVGWTHFMDWVGGWSRDTLLSSLRAGEAARSALVRNPDHALAHALQGKILLWQMQYEAATAQLRTAFNLAPGSAYVNFHFGDVLMWSGSYDAALRHVRRALEIEPDDHGLFLTIEGMTLYFMGELAAAQGVLERAITRNPTYPFALSVMAAVQVEAGNLASAREAASRACRFNRRLSLHYARQQLPIRAPDQRERLAQDWHRAGVPLHQPA